mgnify:CR=1 FL=1
MSVYKLSDLNSTSRALTAEEFREQYSAPFFIHEETESAIDYSGPQTMNMAYMPTQVGQRAAAAWTVYEIRKAEGNLRPAISLGRTDDNDVVLADPSVSKLHAFLTLRPGQSKLQITDVGSKNGTYLRGEPLAPQSSVEIPSGAIITVGRIPLRFISVHEMFLYLQSLREENRL